MKEAMAWLHFDTGIWQWKALLLLFILCIVLSDPPALNHGLGCGAGVTVNRLRAVRFLESEAWC